MDTLLTVLQRLEVKLDALDQRAVPPRLPPQPDPDPNYGRQWEWQPPSWAPEGLLTASTAVTIPSQPFASANGWQQADFLRRGAATQHTSSVSRPTDVYPSTSWDSPFQPHMSLGPQPHDGPPPTSWDRPTTRVGEFHAPRSYWEPSPAFFQQRHLEFAGEGQHGDSFGPSMKSMTPTIPSSWDPPSHRMNFFHHDQRSEWEPSAPRGNPATYTFDPRVGKPLTSWDLPRPRIAPESCSNHSDWDYWVPPTYSESYGGEGYAPYPHYDGGYSGGGYANESNSYAPPPPQVSSYVPVPQPCGSDTPPSYTDSVPGSIEPQREKRERGLASFFLSLKVAEEEGDSKTLGAAESPSPNSVNATSGFGNGGGDINNVVQSSASVTNDDVREKTLELTDELKACDSKAAREGDELVVAKGGDEFVGELVPTLNFGWAVLYQAQEEAIPLGFIPNKKGEGLGEERLKSREVARRSVVFGIYALDEVYKEFESSP